MEITKVLTVGECLLNLIDYINRGPQLHEFPLGSVLLVLCHLSRIIFSNVLKLGINHRITSLASSIDRNA